MVHLYHTYRNYSEVVRRWHESFPTSPPDRRTNRNTVAAFEERGNVEEAPREGRPVSDDHEERKSKILEAIKRSPRMSAHRLAFELHMPRTSIRRILHEEGLKPYHPQLVHGLQATDYGRRVEFCTAMLKKVEDGELDIARILWSDEAIFKLNGHVNRQNVVYWSDANPQQVIERRPNSPGVTVWAGIWSGGVLGPFFFEGTVTSDSYLEMIKRKVISYVKAKNLVFMHDGAPAHYSAPVRNYLNENVPNLWIGRGGTIEWPPRSPDLTPPDFFLWGFVKNLVYAEKCHSVSLLKIRIRQAFAEVNVELCQKVCQSVPVRLKKCIDVHGAQTELR
ncbi:transposase [Ancylostoma caninum]|uniref:Transposase n=1 Tax=Ancylostoma caninum TaxID=29170 RepID=A0A368H0P6_ANCCA|nr:transposase [Ancylostoma caninum]